MIQISRRHRQLRLLRWLGVAQALGGINSRKKRGGSVKHLRLAIGVHARQVMGIRIAHVRGYHDIRLCGIEAFVAWHRRISSRILVLTENSQARQLRGRQGK